MRFHPKTLSERGRVRTGFLPRSRLFCLYCWRRSRRRHAAERVVCCSQREIYDGRGGPPVRGDVAVRDGASSRGHSERLQCDPRSECQRAAVAPASSTRSLGHRIVALRRPRHERIKQGVTLEFRRRQSMVRSTTASAKRAQDAGVTSASTQLEHLGEYLETLVKKGSPKRRIVHRRDDSARVRIGYNDRAPTPKNERMQTRAPACARALSAWLIAHHAPARTRSGRADPLASAAGEFAEHISHMRSEGDRFMEALDELIRISREAKVPAEAYHLKAGGQKNWPKMREAIAKIEAARKAGLQITADMYPYTAGATGLDAAMPTWVQQGGIDGWVAQLKKPDVRKRVVAEMRDPNGNWESLLLAAGSPERVLLIGFKTEKLKPLTGKTLAEVAKMRGVSPEDAAIDLVIEDHTRVGTAYFLMSEENVKLGLSQPWVAIGSDAEAPAPEGPFLLSNPHPRAYGAFARFIGRYVRDQNRNVADAILA